MCPKRQIVLCRTIREVLPLCYDVLPWGQTGEMHRVDLDFESDVEFGDGLFEIIFLTSDS